MEDSWPQGGRGAGREWPGTRADSVHALARSTILLPGPPPLSVCLRGHLVALERQEVVPVKAGNQLGAGMRGRQGIGH